VKFAYVNLIIFVTYVIIILLKITLVVTYGHGHRQKQFLISIITTTMYGHGNYTSINFCKEKKDRFFEFLKLSDSIIFTKNLELIQLKTRCDFISIKHN
jgi:hypothetical protein